MTNPMDFIHNVISHGTYKQEQKTFPLVPSGSCISNGDLDAKLKQLGDTQDQTTLEQLQKAYDSAHNYSGPWLDATSDKAATRNALDTFKSYAKVSFLVPPNEIPLGTNMPMLVSKLASGTVPRATMDHITKLLADAGDMKDPSKRLALGKALQDAGLTPPCSDFQDPALNTVPGCFNNPFLNGNGNGMQGAAQDTANVNALGTQVASDNQTVQNLMMSAGLPITG